MTLIISILIGLLAGILSGLLGIGGGTVVIPALIYFLHMNQHQAQGTSLVALLLPVGLLAVIEYYKSGYANLKVGLIIALGLFIGAYFGAKIAGSISDSVLRKAFAVFFVLIALRMFFKK